MGSILSGLGSGLGNTSIDQLIFRLGGINNAMNKLSTLLNTKGIDARQLAINEIKGKHYSKETIEQFRVFARQSGLSDQQIDEALGQCGLL